MDAAEPSTNGISASNLYRLSSFFEDESYAQIARTTVLAFEAELLQHPFLFSSMLESVVVGRLGMTGVVITGEDGEVEAALRKIRGEVGVTRTVVRLGGQVGRWEWLRGRNGLLGSMDVGRRGVWVCEEGACREESGVYLDEGTEVGRAAAGDVAEGADEMAKVEP